MVIDSCLVMTCLTIFPRLDQSLKSIANLCLTSFFRNHVKTAFFSCFYCLRYLAYGNQRSQLTIINKAIYLMGTLMELRNEYLAAFKS